MTIRQATPSDAAAIAPLLLLAMEEIVYDFIGRRHPQEAEAFLRYFVERENNQYAYQNCRVVERGGTIVAAANVYNGADLPVLRQPVVEQIRMRYQPHFIPEDETGPGEYYLDTIGVAPHLHGQGIGTLLLQHLLSHYVHKQGRVLGLLVEVTNPSARNLYERLGFRAVDRKILFGKPMTHMQAGKP